MASFLSQEWLDAQRAATAALPERPGASARIEYRVSGGPDGEVVFHTVLEAGRIVDNALGADPDADFSVLVPYEEFVAVVDGRLDPNVGFMQGRIKVIGNIGKLLAVMPVTTSDEWRAAMAQIADRTAP